MFLVYKITNTTNNKIYFGYTSKSLEYRWKRHITEKRNRIVTNNIKKYGADNFTIQEMYSFESVEEAKTTEIYLIAIFQTNILKYPHSNGMNMTDGGEGTYGHKHSPHTIEKMRKIQGNKSEEWKRKISLGHRGKKLSEEHKKKIGEGGIGRRLSEEQKKKWIGKNNPFYGQIHTKETKEIIRQHQVKNMKAVYQKDKNDNILNIFPSISEASRTLNIGKSEIIKVCKGKNKTAGGFNWEYMSG